MVELMVAMAISLIILTAIGTAYLSSKQTYRVQDDNSRLQENGRYALEVIGRGLRQAGADQEMSSNPVVTTLDCAPPTCTPINGTNGTPDAVQVQFYAGRDEDNGGTWGARDCTGAHLAANQLVTNNYTLGGGELTCNGVALAADVEDLQVLYGRDLAGANQSADQYAAAQGTWTTNDWNGVVSARICVLVRSNNDNITTAPQRYMNCDGALGIRNSATDPLAFTTPTDRRLRRAFVGTFNLRNRVTAIP